VRGLKLNLGSGTVKIRGYVPVDVKLGSQVFPLTYIDNTITEIRASHILEHFSHCQSLNVLKHWVGKLRPGGLIKLAVPDFAKIAKRYVQGKFENIEGYTVGGHTDAHDKHGAIFDDSSLRQLMTQAGLIDIKPWKSTVKDCASLPISLNLQGSRPAIVKKALPVVHAVMSMPRLAFTDNMFAVFKAMVEARISFSRGCGVFWGQILTRLMEEHLHDGTDYIITCDYDTWFTRKHVKRLLQLIQDNPEVDAIVPVQMKRGENYPLIGVPPKEKNQREVTVPVREFLKPLTPIVIGHFGLTLFRTAALRKFKQPWFMPVPDKQNTWGEGRTDEDVNFWQKFAKQGFKTCLANEIRLGHLQMICVFPGDPRDGFKPIYTNMNALDRGEIPPGCEPEIY